MNRTFISLTTMVLLLHVMHGNAQTLEEGFMHPQDSARTKVWWFHGETVGTHEGITADLQAFREQGVGGVVYYDQVHGDGKGAFKVFSPAWWDELIFSAQEAKRLGLGFEINIGNGYVAGGKWITPDKGMQRLAVAERLVEGGQEVTCKLPLPRRHRNWHQEVAVLAIPYNEALLGDSKKLKASRSNDAEGKLVYDFGKLFTARSITYEVTPIAKARTSAMPVPKTHRPLEIGDPHRFYGAGYREVPDVGMLEVSVDGEYYTKVCDLHPRYRSLGGVKQQTIAFPAVKGRYFRVSLNGKEKVTLGEVVISARACVDEWEEKACWMPEFIDADMTPIYHQGEVVDPEKVIDITEFMAADGTLRWNAPKGQWLVMRFVAVSTGGHTKHGRAEQLGLECDKLSVDAVHLHWQSYTKPVIDSIRAHGGKVDGVCMDSHEAGPQNWTTMMPENFLRLRRYDLKRYLPTMVGLVVGDSHESSRFLYDLRRTLSDLMTENYYGEFNRLCHAEGLVLTAQAIGGALCFPGDHIEVKKLVDKPQGEFWGYQVDGNYDIKDCSSAAHVYGKQIASGEAFTDINYKHTLADIKKLADGAYAYGINEFVVCAVAYQPWVRGVGEPLKINTANGRQYVLNRLNTQWPVSSSFWDYQARCSWMMRQGAPVSDLLVYLGDDVPNRILEYRLPDIPKGFDFDAITTDGLMNRISVKDGALILPDGVTYRMLILPSNQIIPNHVQQKVDAIKAQGVPVYAPVDSRTFGEMISQSGLVPDVDAPNFKDLYFAHRQTEVADIYFIHNHGKQSVSDQILLKVAASSAERWNAVTGERYQLPLIQSNGRTAIHLSLAPWESTFIILSKGPSTAPMQRTYQHEKVYKVDGPWTVNFDPAMGGPQNAVVFESLTDWSKNDDQRIKYYSGTAVYRQTFWLSAKDRSSSYRLRIPQLYAAAEVIVNGKSAGTIWCSPWDVDITSHLKKGRNHIEIRVVNSLWNRLVGDASLPESERITWQTHPLANPNDRLVPSGIVGSVEIVEMK